MYITSVLVENVSIQHYNLKGYFLRGGPLAYIFGFVNDSEFYSFSSSL